MCPRPSTATGAGCEEEPRGPQVRGPAQPAAPLPCRARAAPGLAPAWLPWPSPAGVVPGSPPRAGPSRAPPPGTRLSPGTAGWCRNRLSPAGQGSLSAIAAGQGAPRHSEAIALRPDASPTSQRPPRSVLPQRALTPPEPPWDIPGQWVLLTAPQVIKNNTMKLPPHPSGAASVKCGL